MLILRDHPLKKLNTFGINASANYYTEFTGLEELTEILSDPQFLNLRKLILGGGSNLLFTGDFDGLVLKNNLKGITLMKEDDEFYFIRCEAGEVWHEFVLHCVEHRYGGL